MTAHEPEISVILPTRNRGGIIAHAIASVLAQEDVWLELIVIDDGSADDTPQVVGSFADDRIVFERNTEGTGGNAARNQGIRLAKAPVVAFIDDDDRYLPRKLRTELDLLAQRPDVDVILSGFISEGRLLDESSWAPRPNPAIDDNDRFREGLYLRSLRKATPGICVRKAAAVRAGGFDESLRRSQDFDFLVRLTEVARCIAIPDLLWVKSWQRDSIAKGRGDKVDSMLQLCRKHPEWVKDARYRPGLARDVAKHLKKLVRRRNYLMAARDLLKLGRAFGIRTTLQLLRTGSRDQTR